MATAATAMKPPPLPKPKTKLSIVENASSPPDSPSNTNRPAAPTVPTTPPRSQPQQQYRPFAPIPSITGSVTASGKPDLENLEDVDIPLQPPNLLPHETLSNSQLHAYKSVLANNKHSNPEDLIVPKEKPVLAKDAIMDYVYDWASWASSIPDDSRRKEVLGFVTAALERALKHAIERTGITLTPADLNGVENGVKRTVEEEVSIKVIIRSTAKEVKGGKGDVKSVRAKLNDAKGPTAEQLAALEQASKATHTASKRGAEHTDLTDDGRGGKRQKLNHDEKKDASGSGDRSASPSVSPVTDAKRAKYRQQIFQPRLNHLLKRAGKTMTRGKCANWETARTKLADAGADVKHRNLMLKDFLSGHEKWDGDPEIDPNVELYDYVHGDIKGFAKKVPPNSGGKKKAEGVKKEESPQMEKVGAAIAEAEGFKIEEVQPPPRVQINKVALSGTTPDKMLVIIRIEPGHDPADWSAYGTYQYENLIFDYATRSTVRERMDTSDSLREQVDSKLDEAGEDLNSLVGKKMIVKTEKGKKVASGLFLPAEPDEPKPDVDMPEVGAVA